MIDKNALAARLQRMGDSHWIPEIGPCTNVTLTPDERKAIIAALTGGGEAEPTVTNLERFAIAVLDDARTDFGDVDGGWLQDKAVELGILKGITVTEACSEEGCACAEVSDFPQDCYRYADDVQAKRTVCQYVPHETNEVPTKEKQK